MPKKELRHPRNSFVAQTVQKYRFSSEFGHLFYDTNEWKFVPGQNLVLGTFQTHISEKLP